MRSPATLGAENFRKLVRQGQRRCRRSPKTSSRRERLDALEAYLLTLGTKRRRRSRRRRTRRCGCRRTRRGIRDRTCATPARSRPAGTPATACPPSGPPFTQLVAYDLNDGSVKWRIAGRHVAGTRRQGHHRHGQRAAEERSGGHRRRPGDHRQRSGSQAARLRQGRRAPALGARDPRQPGGHSRGLRRSWAAIHRVLRRARRGARAAIRSGATRFTASRPRRRPGLLRVRAAAAPRSDRDDDRSSPHDDTDVYDSLSLARSRSPAAWPARSGSPASGTVHAQPLAQGQAAFERAPDALERVTWRTRTLVGDERLTRWKLAVRPEGLALLDAVVRADALVVNFVEGQRGQAGRADDIEAARRAADRREIAAVRAAMGTIGLLTYRVDELGADAAAQRQALQLAKALGAQTVVVSGRHAAVAGSARSPRRRSRHRRSRCSPRPTRSPASSRASTARTRTSASASTPARGSKRAVSPADALAAIGDRLRYVNLRDRAGMGASSRNVQSRRRRRQARRVLRRARATQHPAARA